MAPRPRHAGDRLPASGLLARGDETRPLLSPPVGFLAGEGGGGGGARVYGRVHKYLFIHRQTNKKSQAHAHTLTTIIFLSSRTHTKQKCPEKMLRFECCKTRAGNRCKSLSLFPGILPLTSQGSVHRFPCICNGVRQTRHPFPFAFLNPCPCLCLCPLTLSLTLPLPLLALPRPCLCPHPALRLCPSPPPPPATQTSQKCFLWLVRIKGRAKIRTEKDDPNDGRDNKIMRCSRQFHKR